MDSNPEAPARPVTPEVAPAFAKASARPATVDVISGSSSLVGPAISNHPESQ
jgi:hypothetical protein